MTTLQPIIRIMLLPQDLVKEHICPFLQPKDLYALASSLSGSHSQIDEISVGPNVRCQGALRALFNCSWNGMVEKLRTNLRKAQLESLEDVIIAENADRPFQLVMSGSSALNAILGDDGWDFNSDLDIYAASSSISQSVENFLEAKDFSRVRNSSGYGLSPQLKFSCKKMSNGVTEVDLITIEEGTLIPGQVQPRDLAKAFDLSVCATCFDGKNFYIPYPDLTLTKKAVLRSTYATAFKILMSLRLQYPHAAPFDTYKSIGSCLDSTVLRQVTKMTKLTRGSTKQKVCTMTMKLDVPVTSINALRALHCLDKTADRIRKYRHRGFDIVTEKKEYQTDFGIQATILKDFNVQATILKTEIALRKGEIERFFPFHRFQRPKPTPLERQLRNPSTPVQPWNDDSDALLNLLLNTWTITENLVSIEPTIEPIAFHARIFDHPDPLRFPNLPREGETTNAEVFKSFTLLRYGLMSRRKRKVAHRYKKAWKLQFQKLPTSVRHRSRHFIDWNWLRSSSTTY